MAPIERLIRELSRLPGVGERTATRLAFFIMRQPPEFARGLAGAIVEMKERTRLCSECMGLTEEDTCAICRDPRRDPETICVVEHPQDAMAIERTGAYRGRYHILHGAISPLDGIGPEELKVAELMRRLEGGRAREIIIATSANVEGEATALYLTRLIRPSGIKVTRLASGIPVGGSLEYVDASTISKAIEGRREF